MCVEQRWIEGEGQFDRYKVCECEILKEKDKTVQTEHLHQIIRLSSFKVQYHYQSHVQIHKLRKNNFVNLFCF